MRYLKLKKSLSFILIFSIFMSFAANLSYGISNAELRPLIKDAGTVNCRPGESCVKKIGDKAKVSWIVQTTPFLLSADESLFVGGTIIAIPKVLKNVSLETLYLPDVTEENKNEVFAIDDNKETKPFPVKKVEAKVKLVPTNNETGERCDASPNGMLTSPSVTNDKSNWCAAFYEPNLADTEDKEKTKLAFDEKKRK